MKEYRKNLPSLLDLVQDGKLKDFTEEEWKEKCFARWSWMRNYYNSDYNKNMTPAKMGKAQEIKL
jgi:hypothetical protein